VHDVLPLRCDYPTGPNEIRSNHLAAFPKKKGIDFTNGIFLGGNGASNYYHWLIEILPKMEFVNQLGQEFAKYPLLISESAKKHKSFQDSLKFFAHGRPVIYLDDKKYFTVQNLVTFTTPSNIPFNLTTEEAPRIEDFKISPDSVHYIREEILSRHIPKKTPNRRIFLTLENLSRKYNEEEVFKVFERLGFEKVYIDKLSFQQQVDMMQEAEMIAGPTGAAWANLIFCKTGIKCLCWMDEFATNFSSFSNIAQILKVKLHYFFFENGTKTTSEIYKKDYKLDSIKLKKILTAILNSE
jgi:capsular polysaccharide biosynthesis protein